MDYKDFMDTAWSLAAGADAGDATWDDAYWTYTFSEDGKLIPSRAAHIAAPALRLASQVLHAATVLSNLPIAIDFIAKGEPGGIEDTSARWILDLFGQEVADLETAARVLAAYARELAADIGHNTADYVNRNDHLRPV